MSEVAGLQNIQMMLGMTGNDKSSGASRDFPAVGRAASIPGFRIQVLKKLNCRAAHTFEFGNNVPNRQLSMPGVLRPRLLIETRQRRAVTPRKHQSPIGENPLGIDDVAEHLFDGPFAGLVAKVAFGIIDGSE